MSESMVERVIASRRELVTFQGFDKRGARGWYVCEREQCQDDDREPVAGPFATSVEADKEAERINARAAIEAMDEAALLARIRELESALRPFTFSATPGSFQSGDPTTMVSVLLHEPDVVEARQVIGRS